MAHRLRLASRTAAALIEPVDAGITFPAADPVGLQRAVASLWLDPERLAAKAANARAAFEAHYTARANLKQLRKIYDAARATVEARRTKPLDESTADIPLDTSCICAPAGSGTDFHNKPTTGSGVTGTYGAASFGAISLMTLSRI